MPVLNKKFWTDRRFWLLALIPNIMFLLFYLPICRQFMNVLQLGEGWSSRGSVLQAAIMALLAVFLPVLPFMKIQRKNLYRYAVLLIPAAFALLSPTPPFPRVFLAFLPLFVLIAAEGIAVRKERTLCYAALLVFLWGAFVQTAAFREFLSEKTAGGEQDDDFFYGYYLRETHKPSDVIGTIRRSYPHGVPAIYMSFGADPWALMFYCNFSGYPAKTVFDGPWGKVPELPSESMVVLRSDEDPAIIGERFGRNLIPFVQKGRNHVYIAR
jgi:hypothetical protein